MDEREKLRVLIETASNAVEVVFAKLGALRPMWFCIDAQGGLHTVGDPVEDKDAAAVMMRAMFELLNIVRYVFVDEAWVVRRPAQATEAEIARVHREGASQQPDRIEVVIFLGEDENGVLMAGRLIERPASGKARLAPLEFYDAKTMEGSFVGLLPRRGANVQ